MYKRGHNLFGNVMRRKVEHGRRRVMIGQQRKGNSEMNRLGKE